MIAREPQSIPNQAIAQRDSLQESSQAAQARSRLFFIDHLRVALTALVIIHHLAVTYGAVAVWYYVEPPGDAVTPLVLLLFVLLNQAFFMGSFFLIAGYFTPGSYDRKGAGAFLRDRLVRLGIPLLVFTLVINPLVGFLGYNYLPEQIRPGPSPSFWEFYLLAFGPGPLWFVEALLLFSALYVLWRWLVRGQARPATGEGSPPSLPAVVGFILGLAGVTFLLRIVLPIGLYLPVVGFPTASHLPQYLGLFVAGSLAYRRGWFQSISDRAGLVGFVAAVVATILLAPLALSDLSGAFAGGLNWRAFVYALWEAIFSVGMCLGLLTLFRKRFARQGALGRFLSLNAYSAYIIHAPVIVALTIALRDIQIHPLLKFALVVPVALPLCFLAAHLVRKLPGARAIL